MQKRMICIVGYPWVIKRRDHPWVSDDEAMQHIVFCTLSFLMIVPEENINEHSNDVVPNLGYHVNKRYSLLLIQKDVSVF